MLETINAPGDGGVQQHRLNERTAERFLLIEDVGVLLHGIAYRRLSD